MKSLVTKSLLGLVMFGASSYAVETRKCKDGSTILVGENADIFLSKTPPYIKKNVDGQTKYACCDASGAAREFDNPKDKDKFCFSVGVPVTTDIEPSDAEPILKD
jgi:hypothetical protein